MRLGPAWRNGVLRLTLTRGENTGLLNRLFVPMSMRSVFLSNYTIGLH